MSDTNITTAQRAARAAALDRWAAPASEPYKGKLIDMAYLEQWERDHGNEPPPSSCMCAQGQGLHYEAGVSLVELINMPQQEADTRIMALYGISRRHAILLRVINNKKPGAPTSVLATPSDHLGVNAELVLKFWHHLDQGDVVSWNAKFTAFWKSNPKPVRQASIVAFAAAAAFAFADADAFADAAADAFAAAAADAAADADAVDFADAFAYADAVNKRSRFFYTIRYQPIITLATFELIAEDTLKAKGIPLLFLTAFGFESGADMMAKLGAA